MLFADDRFAHPTFVANATLAFAPMETAKTKSSRSLRDLAALVGVSWWASDPEGGDAAGRSLDDLLDLVHPGDHQAVCSAAAKALAEGQSLDVAFRSSSDPVRFMRASADVGVKSGEMVVHSAVLLDETDRVRAQAKLSMLADETPALLWVMDPNGFCSFFSRSWYQYTGQSPEDALGLGWLKMVHPADISMATECARRAAEQKTHFRIEHRLRRHDGSWRWVTCVGNPRFAQDGSFLGHSGAVTDIHDRRLGEQRMRESDERYKHFIASSADPIWRVEMPVPLPADLPPSSAVPRIMLRSKLAECNQAFLDLMGVGSLAELVGTPLGMLLPSAGSAHALESLVHRGYQLRHEPIEVLGPDQQRIQTTISMVGFLENGTVTHFWCSYALPRAAPAPELSAVGFDGSTPAQ
ncbi:PAS domain-containing protein [Ramlibacter humi]|uniref:histidine kinase n=1 Tax=Ramlibacter humi TaxID=2530451 RepID=A0A4Z0BQM1_9BURK|nr:PAS domain-containing protein [Ramlibacter humi]TFZ00289.1 PAS domain S-box protein [Ramlibacter humi]